ncbi:MAG: S41 family peptidase [Candidatus Cyclobacteriaceae bacterium M2_1C_046]
MRKIKLFSLVVLTFIGAGVAFTPTDNYFAIAKNLDIFASLFKEVNALYVDEIDPEIFVATGMEAMLESLDPYTNYIPEQEVENFRSLTTGQYAGIGAIIGKVKNKIVITRPYASFPADKAGLKIGDEIVSIDGVPVESKEISEISNMLRGQADTEIQVMVKRFGQDDLLNFRFDREKVKIINVPYAGLVGDQIGYIKLDDFTVGAGREVSDAVEKLKIEGAEKIILDLRDNPGGLLNEAVNVVNVFVPKGKTVVETRGRVKEWNKAYKTLNNPVDIKIPVVVLINERSASASEIVAGAIQDYDRGILVGRKTFGKGLVQTTRGLSYNSQLKITTAKYYTPSGRCIQAIDYTDKNKDEAASIPDSLRVAFKTSNGRTVFDGGGLNADVRVAIDEPAAITEYLYKEGYIFNYATEWYYSNPDKKLFAKNDEEYSKFKKWLSDKKFNYNTEVEGLLNHLKVSAENESYYKKLREEISSLESAINADKKNDLEKFKTEILELLEQEIASRLSLYEGQIKAHFDDDKDILEAVEILKKENSLDQILSRN